MPAALKTIPAYAKLIRISCLEGVENSAENIAKLDLMFEADETKIKMLSENAADFFLDGVQLSRTPFRPLKVTPVLKLSADNLFVFQSLKIFRILNYVMIDLDLYSENKI